LQGRQPIVIDFTENLNSHLNNRTWQIKYTFEDEYRNHIFQIPIITYFSDPGSIELNKLKIQYNYSFPIPDLSEQLNGLIKSVGESHGQEIKVTLRFESATNGELEIKNLELVYSHPTTASDYPEILCLAIIVVIVIVIALVIKFARFGNRKRPEPSRPENTDHEKKVDENK
jgi:hypothetical protein